MKDQALFFRGNDEGSSLALALVIICLVVLIYFPYASLIHYKLLNETKNLENILMRISNENIFYVNYFEDFFYENE